MLDPLAFEDLVARFFTALFNQMSLQIFWGWGVSSFSFGLVAFWCCFHIHDLGSFLQNEFNSLGGKETFSMLWNQLCSMEITCFYFLFVPLFL